MLFLKGMLENNCAFDAALVNSVDEDGPVPDIQTNNNVQVPDLGFELSEEEFQIEYQPVARPTPQ